MFGTNNSIVLVGVAGELEKGYKEATSPDRFFVQLFLFEISF